MKTPKVDNRGVAEAQAAQARAQQAAQNLQQNMSQDLSNSNIVEAVAGGSADISGVSGGDNRRKPKGAGLSSQLGVNLG